MASYYKNARFKLHNDRILCKALGSVYAKYELSRIFVKTKIRDNSYFVCFNKCFDYRTTNFCATVFSPSWTFKK